MSMTIGDAQDVQHLLADLINTRAALSSEARARCMRLADRSYKVLNAGMTGPEVLVALDKHDRPRTLHVVEHADGEFGWHAKAPNGEITVRGEGHTRRADAVRAATTEVPHGVLVDDQEVEK